MRNIEIQTKFCNVVLFLVQELTEEGIPFLILFHHPDDTDTPARFRSVVAAEITELKSHYYCHLLIGLTATNSILVVLNCIDS